jgi:hypothetical protein
MLAVEIETKTQRNTKMNPSKLQAVKTYFRGNARYGRTTTLMVKETGQVLGEWVGCMTKKECIQNFEHAQYLASKK